MTAKSLCSGLRTWVDQFIIFLLYIFIYHTATIFAANILYLVGRLHSKSGDNRFIFKKFTIKKSVDPSSPTKTDRHQSLIKVVYTLFL